AASATPALMTFPSICFAASPAEAPLSVCAMRGPLGTRGQDRGAGLQRKELSRYGASHPPTRHDGVPSPPAFPALAPLSLRQRSIDDERERRCRTSRRKRPRRAPIPAARRFLYHIQLDSSYLPPSKNEALHHVVNRRVLHSHHHCELRHIWNPPDKHLM